MRTPTEIGRAPRADAVTPGLDTPGDTAPTDPARSDQHQGHHGASGPGPRIQPRPGTDLTEITAVEGTAAADLSAAIAHLPAGAVLADFGADAEVSLLFRSPAAARTPTTQEPEHPHTP
jgi:uncharacterized repeat protein (TIGR03917 family)